tara:strand:- start:39 stop:575 length:537 start_codon:yes stop_codon:yes gene_type:complete
MSTLHVENLKGLTSGGNANKVIIPTGQTLEVADNIRHDDMPAGSVSQVKHTTHSNFDSTSSSFVDVVSLTFTPKHTGSVIIVRYNGHLYKYHNTANINVTSRLAHDAGGSGSFTTIVTHPYITYTGYSFKRMTTLHMTGAFTTTNTNAHTVKLEINPSGHRTYIYGISTAFTVEEFKQ